MNPARRRRALAFLVPVVVVLSACGGGDGSPAAAPTPSVAPKTSPVAGVSTTATGVTTSTLATTAAGSVVAEKVAGGQVWSWSPAAVIILAHGGPVGAAFEMGFVLVPILIFVVLSRVSKRQSDIENADETDADDAGGSTP